MSGKNNPGALAGATGAGMPSIEAAGTYNIAQTDAQRDKRTGTMALRVRKLRWLGVPPSRAAVVAALAWGLTDD